MSTIIDEISRQLLTNIIQPILFESIITLMETKNTKVTMEELNGIVNMPNIPSKLMGVIATSASSGSVKGISNATAVMPSACTNVNRRTKDKCLRPALLDGPHCKTCKDNLKRSQKLKENKLKAASSPTTTSTAAAVDETEDSDEDGNKQPIDVASRCILVDDAKHFWKDPSTNFAVFYDPDSTDKPAVYAYYIGSNQRKMNNDEKMLAQREGFLVDESHYVMQPPSAPPSASKTKKRQNEHDEEEKQKKQKKEKNSDADDDDDIEDSPAPATPPSPVKKPKPAAKNPSVVAADTSSIKTAKKASAPPPPPPPSKKATIPEATALDEEEEVESGDDEISAIVEDNSIYEDDDEMESSNKSPRHSTTISKIPQPKPKEERVNVAPAQKVRTSLPKASLNAHKTSSSSKH